MSTPMCEEEEEEMRPMFYRIIHSSLNTTRHLRIPPDFVKHIANDGSGRAVLEDPSGEHWNVKLCKTADATYLQDGWQDFLKNHSLGKYEFLVFRYEGNMLFNVQIFDKTGCMRPEHRLPAISTVQQRQHPASLKPRKRAPTPRKKFVIHCLWRRGRGRPSKAKSCTKNPVLEAVAVETTSSQEEKAWKAAMSFTSKFPHFASRLAKFNVEHSNMLNLPTAFANAFLPKCKKEVVLEDRRGNVWTVNFIPRNHAFCGGWSRFVQENQLKEGDICVFELVDDLKMCVHFFPIS